MDQSVLSLARMARRIGVQATWLKGEADAGRIPCLRAGKKYLFAPAAVEKTLAERATREVAK